MLKMFLLKFQLFTRKPRRNLKRRSYLRNIRKRFLIKKRYEKKRKKKLQKVKILYAKRNINKLHKAIINITLKRRNTFFVLAKNINITKKIAYKHRLLKKKYFCKTYFSGSVGRVLYKGRAKSSAIARETLAKLLLQKL